MDLKQKLERLEKWTARFPFLDCYVLKTEDALRWTADIDALCRSLVKDYYVCMWLSLNGKRKTSMALAMENMFGHADIAVESRDGKMLYIDTKYPSKPFSKDSEMWFEIDKNKKSGADKIFYINDDGYGWILDRNLSVEALSSKLTYAGKSGDKLCRFKFNDLDSHAIGQMKMLGVFDKIRGKLVV